jgi:hypothetical protein
MSAVRFQGAEVRSAVFVTTMSSLSFVQEERDMKPAVTSNSKTGCWNFRFIFLILMVTDTKANQREGRISSYTFD